MKVIGITISQEEGDHPRLFTLPKLYAKAIEYADGVPILLPIVEKKLDLISKYLKIVDGILLTGGVDVDPLLFNEEPHPELGRIDPYRDFFELHLARKALEKDIPILGICRGCQLLNVAAGGSLIQDIYANYQNDCLIKHQQKAPRWHPTHTIEIKKGSKLEKIFGCAELSVNSFHHQAVKEAGVGFVASAHAKDGVIEAIEGIEYRYAVGVQWHPELMWEHNSLFFELFKSFVEKC